MSKTGVRELLYKYFRKQEKRLYTISDHIGCMSQANIDYVIKHNPEVNSRKVEVCPNTIDPIDMSCGFIPISAFYWFGWGLYKGSVGDDDSFFFLPAYRNLVRFIDRALESYGLVV